MPVTIPGPLRRLSQAEFREVAYEVMGQMFAIHRDLGRFFDEAVYKRELARRLPDVRLEVPIEIAFGPFRKYLFLDAVAGGGGAFEFKAVDRLGGPHRAQLLQYLMLADLAHGKLVNLRPPQVEHEFVNTTLRLADRTRFEVRSDRWDDAVPELAALREFMTALLRDLGTGLMTTVYEEAAAQTETLIAVSVDGHALGDQQVRRVAPETALQVTAFDSLNEGYEVHARRWLAHVNLRAIAWIDVGRRVVTFTVIHK